MRLLTGAEISTLLRKLTPQDAKRLCESLSSGLSSYSLEKDGSNRAKLIHQPLRTVFQTRNNDTTLVMPISDTSTTAVKVAMVPQEGDINGAITVYSPVGELKGVLNAAEITAFRTALATMTILTKWNTPSNAKAVVFGAGKQAEWNIRLTLLLVPGVRRIAIFNRGSTRLQRFEENVLSALRQAYPNVQFEAHAQKGSSQYQEIVAQRLANADIISCCTPSVAPLFAAKELQIESRSHRFLSLIGSYKPEMQEVDTETIRLGGKILVDSKESCLEEAGELIRAGLQPKDLVEVGELFSGSKEAMELLETAAPLTIFKCVGLGIMDLVISKALLDMAEEMNTGTVLEGF